MSLNTCFICNKPITLESDVVLLKSKGVDSLISASKQRLDDKWLKFNEHMKVHIKCRKDYTRPQSIKTAINTVNAAKEMQSTSYISPTKG